MARFLSMLCMAFMLLTPPFSYAGGNACDASCTHNIVDAAIANIPEPQSPIRAFGKIADDGTVVKATGLTCVKTNTGRYTVILSPAMSDEHYVIQLTAVDANRAPSGDANIYVSKDSQTNSSFSVNIDYNDDGGGVGVPVDLPFMITVID